MKRANLTLSKKASHLGFKAKLLIRKNDWEPNPWWLHPSDGLGKHLFILPSIIHILVLQMRHPHSFLYSIMIFCPFETFTLSLDHVDRRSNKSTSSRESTQRSRGQKIMIESWTHWGYLIFQTGTRGKINRLFPRPSDGGNHHGLGSRSFSVSNNFAQNPKCDALFDRVRLRKVLS